MTTGASPCRPQAEACRPAVSASLLQQYRELSQAGGLFVEDARGFRHRCNSTDVRFAVRPGIGAGWAELAQVGDGLILGRADYRFEHPTREEQAASGSPMGFMLLLSGHVAYRGPGRHSNGTVQAGELWFRAGEFGAIHCDQPAHQRIQGISIDLPAAMVETLREEQQGDVRTPFSELLHNRRPHVVESAVCRQVAGIAARLLAAENESVVGRLELESLTLELLARVLGPMTKARTLTPPLKPCRRRRAAFDDAVDILSDEYAHPHTISSLSRRVGLNECYLKSAFKEYAGTTVGAYLRTLRMRRAHDLIESGNHSVQQVALFVGYSNPSHFAAAFRGMFGISPSALQQTPTDMSKP